VASFTRVSRQWLHRGDMRPIHEPDSGAGWQAVHALVEHWADLPPTSWRMLVSAERMTPATTPAPVPEAFDRWLVRDLVETAWMLASRNRPEELADWTEEARGALERLAWRLLDTGDERSHQDVPH
jgi:hypothetical protein